MIERLALGACARCGGIVVGTLGIVALSASGPAAPATDRGFAVTSFYHANNDGGPEACPEGLAVAPPGWGS